MKTILALPFYLILVFAVQTPACGFAASTPSPGQEFMILYSNNVDGEVEPCG